MKQLKENISTLFNFFKKRKEYENNNINPHPPLIDSDNNHLSQRLNDYWQNNVANLNAHNSIMQHSHFVLDRLGYSEISALSTDDIIHNAIETISRECLSNWGSIVVYSDDENAPLQEIQAFLEKRLYELDFQKILYNLVQKSLTFGGAFLFMNISGMQDLEKSLVLANETKQNKLLNLVVLEPWQVAPAVVNMDNAIQKDYMQPSLWSVNGILINSTRLYPLVFFEIPLLIKPLFNFLGVSLVQLMKEKVKSSESMRHALSDIFLRFRTNIIRTPSLLSMDSDTLKQRVELLNMGVNNFSTLLLSDSETFEQSITPTSGLDRLYAQATEGIASAARIPINKLFGQTPTGLNNSGEYDITSFYDTIRGYQINTIKPCIEKIMKTILNEKYDINITRAVFEFSPLEKLKKQDDTNVKNMEAEFYSKLIQAGIITQEDALSELQKKGYLSMDIKIPDEVDIDMDIENDMDNDMDIENSTQNESLK